MTPKGQTQSAPAAGTKRLARRTAIGLALLVVLAAAGVIAARLLEPLALRQVEILTGTQISIEDSSFRLNGSVTLEGLQIRTEDDPRGPVLEADRLRVKFSPASLLRRKPILTGITVSGAVLHARYDDREEKWNLEKLLDRRQDTRAPAVSLPQVHIAESLVRVSRTDGEHSRTLLEVPIRLEARTIGDAAAGYDFRLSSVRGDAGEPGRWSMEIQGRISDLAGFGDFAVNAEVKNFVLAEDADEDAMAAGRDLVEIVHPELLRLYTRYQPAGTVDAAAGATGSLVDIARSNVTATINLKDAYFCDVRYPYPLHEVNGEVFMVNGDFAFENIIGRHGETQVAISGRSRIEGDGRNIEMLFQSDRAVIDDNVYRALPTEQKKIWFQFSPAGTAAFESRFRKTPDGERTLRTRVDLINAKFAYEQFPYQFRNVTGTLYFESERVRIVNVVSRNEDDARVTFNGEITGLPSPEPKVRIGASARAMPIDSQFLAALARRPGEALYRDFEFEAVADADINIYSRSAPQWHVAYDADATLRTPLLRWTETGLELRDAVATLSLTPDAVELRSAVGTCNDGLVKLEGRLKIPQPQDQDAPAYSLDVAAEEIEICPALLGLLPAGARPLLEEISPSGRIDITTTLNSDEPGKIEQTTKIRCLENTVELTEFDYSLTDVTGTIEMAEHAVDFNDFTAVAVCNHTGEAAAVSFNASAKTGENGLESLRAAMTMAGGKWNPASRSVVHRLVPGLYDALKPAGDFDVTSLDLELDADAAGELAGRYGLAFRLTGNSFGEGDVSEVDASLEIEGKLAPGGALADMTALFNAENMTVMGKKVADIVAPMKYDSESGTWSTGDFRGKCYGGSLLGDISVSRGGDDYAYQMRLGFNNVDMRKFFAAGRNDADPNSTSSGNIRGSLSLGGQLGHRQARTGRLQAHVSDMRIGRLGMMAKVLLVLNLTPSPDDVAFKDCSLDAYVKGDRVLIDSIAMSGPSLNFKGSGELDLATRKVHIDLSAGSVESSPGLLRSLAVGLSRAIVYVRISGTLDEPAVTVNPLPFVDRTFRMLGDP